ncbi:head decoration protein [Pokkaliibacter sp. CJK22405]|uniref:head decoration protein n=1 Tax=Pokkaliibacter sp. CJK22405 TaxID=3384615 RepID=UPI003984D0E2
MTTETIPAYQPTITGSGPRDTDTVTIALGQNLAALTPLGQVAATGEFVAWNPAADDGSQNATRLSAFAVDATTAAKSAGVFRMGTYNRDLIVWPDGVTDAQKLAAFTQTAISLG